MLTRSLGKNGPTSSAIGLGCMGMSDFYGPSDRAESIATIRAALDANVTLLDTGDFYGMGHNEMLKTGLLEADDTTNPPLLSYRYVVVPREFKWHRVIQPKK